MRPLYVQEDERLNFLIDSMSVGGLFLPGFIQVDVGGIKVGLNLSISGNRFTLVNRGLGKTPLRVPFR